MPKAKKTKTSRSNNGGSGQQKILDFCLFHEKRFNNPNAPRKKALTCSGLKPNTFGVTLSQMKKKGFIGFDKDSVRLTEEGRAKANPEAEISTVDNDSAQKDIKARYKVGGQAAVFFDLLTDGLVHDRESVVGGLVMKKTSANVMLSVLKKHGIIEFDRTTVKMTDLCFPCGRPRMV